MDAHTVNALEGHRGREPFWDVVRAAALVRVVAWHTWTWTPLSWLAAMPAMFLVGGALLRDSIHFHGYRRTVTIRLRRLLLPFWVYGTVAVTTMVTIGWRPEPSEIVGWVIPLADPVGSDDAPGLWIPLWYLRAYLWFVLLAGILLPVARRLGWWLPALLGLLLAGQQWAGPGMPLAVTDFLAYGIFLAIGMIIAERHRFPSPPSAAAVAVLAGLGAVGLVVTGRAAAVVNTSYSTTVLAGIATVGVALAAANPLRRLARGRSGIVITWMGTRALTIYLWHGMGLFAADRLITQRGIDGVVGVVGSAVVVVVATGVMTAAFGWVEDVAARRELLVRRSLPAAITAAASVIIVPSLVIVPPSEATATPPPSGLAVLATADEIEQELSISDEADAPSGSSDQSTSVEPAVPRSIDEMTTDLALVLERHAAEHAAVLERHDIGFIELVARPGKGPPLILRWTPDGGVAIVEALEPISWYSITKSATAVWLMTLIQEGTVGLDDPLADYLPEVTVGDEITLEHLARHRAGIPGSADTALQEYERLLRPTRDGLDVGADIRTWVASGSLATEPGEAFQYSRVGYGLLAWALERASGASWQTAMRSLADEAGVTLTIDEELAYPGTPNHHPGEGDYRGSAWAGGGLVSSPIDLVGFFHWAFTERLDQSMIDSMTAAAPERTLAYFAVGLTIRCPCVEQDGVLRGARVGNGGSNGWWQHELATGTTLMLSPERAISDTGIVLELHDAEFQEALFEAVRG